MISTWTTRPTNPDDVERAAREAARESIERHKAHEEASAKSREELDRQLAEIKAKKGE